MRRTASLSPGWLALAGSLLLPACGARQASTAAETPAPAAPPMIAVASMPAGAAPVAVTANAQAPQNPTPGSSAVAAQGPLLTFAGEMSLQVATDAPASIDAIIGVGTSVGGYLAARHDASVEIRVPAAHFQEAMRKIEPLGEVTHRSVTTADVSEEFHDTDVRLLNLRATRTRLEGLLSHSGTLADTLAVERELERVALEIDRLEGRLAFLRARIDYASIAVNVSALHTRTSPVSGAAPKKVVELPVSWLGELGVDRLLTLR